ncbi:MAG: nitrogenase-stabilizing/protective protein NifW [Campylobacteraceae bacterium]|jgi:nitrogenase-stabilizing/protective protein|nr:nitrogenase-stabilizing/protective protein NifW [Campylobacteraceae bacterium]
MKTLKEFYELKCAEDYFIFFEINFDTHILNVKRFHIMKEYGALIKKGFTHFESDEERLLSFLKFMLIRVYMDYKNGCNPSAAEVWGMYGKDCFSCAQKGGGCVC